jgi:hypothetical protein
MAVTVSDLTLKDEHSETRRPHNQASDQPPGTNISTDSSRDLLRAFKVGGAMACPRFRSADPFALPDSRFPHSSTPEVIFHCSSSKVSQSRHHARDPERHVISSRTSLGLCQWLAPMDHPGITIRTP